MTICRKLLLILIFLLDLIHPLKLDLYMARNGETQMWSKAILDMIPELPYFRELLVAFFTGAAETWARFISEFAPGGLIDEATIEEKDLAWMPTTNDVNEGALGQFCVMIRHQPQLTLPGHNAIAMYFCNDTE